MIPIRAENKRILGEAASSSNLERAATILVCVAYIAFLLWLPLFPTRDGPMHLYNVHVMGKLLSHSSAAYADFYTIKHLLPPYSLYYYALLALGKVFPLLLADRLILCFYVVLFVFGFRYLARAIGQSADLMTLLASTLLLSFPLVMGFVNFCLSISVGFWMLGHWVRLLETPNLHRRVGVVCLAVIMMLVHPVPLVLAVILMSLQLTDYFLRERRSRPGALPPALLQDLVTLASVASTGLYIRLFTSSDILKQDKPISIMTVIRSRIYTLTHQGNVIAFSETTAPLRIFHLVLGLIPAFAFGLALVQILRRRHNAVAKYQWLAYAVLAWAIYPFLPDEVNGAFYFADRLTILLWITPLLAASAFAAPSRRLRYAVVAVALAFNAANLFFAWKYIRPVALDLAQIERLQPQWGGKVGLLLENGSPMTNGLAYRPYSHSAVHFFRHNDATLDDTIWLDETIIPLGARPSPITRALDSYQRDSQSRVTEALVASPESRAIVLSNVDFILIPTPLANVMPDPYEVMRLDAKSRWTCALVAPTRLQLCTPTPRSFAPGLPAATQPAENPR